MPKLNTYFSKVPARYLFLEIQKKAADFGMKHPECPILDLGISDITEPLPKTAIQAFTDAIAEMGEAETLHGYGPSEGYPFLRRAIQRNDYCGLEIGEDEIFVSTGAKSDMANFQELFDLDNRVAIPDPTYPVYLDSNLLAGRTQIAYLSCTEENGFLPQIPSFHVDLIYLCSPNNPTGVTFTKEQLQLWVDYAREHKAIILFDGAYTAFIIDPHLPRSIYEIEGAREVAVEFRSFSKSAGFTGLRCSYTVVPKELDNLHAFWKRRHDTKFNGVAYPIQRAAASLYTKQGKQEMRALVTTYLERTRYLRAGLQELGYTVYGGKDAPFLWCKTPCQMSSWQFFDTLLENFQIVSVPGSGFGESGEGFVRFSGFTTRSTLMNALQRLKGVPCDSL